MLLNDASSATPQRAQHSSVKHCTALQMRHLFDSPGDSATASAAHFMLLWQKYTRSVKHSRITDASIWWLPYLDEATATLQQLSRTQKSISRSALWVSYVLLESADLQYSGCAKLTHVSTDWVDKLTHAPVSHYCIWECVSHDHSRLSTMSMQISRGCVTRCIDELQVVQKAYKRQGKYM